MDKSSQKANRNQPNSAFNQRAHSLTAGSTTGGAMPGMPSRQQKNHHIYAQYGLMGHDKHDQRVDSGRGMQPPTSNNMNAAANPANDSINVAKQGAFQSRNQSTDRRRQGPGGAGGTTNSLRGASGASAGRMSDANSQ